jgi:hypothetical protein
MYCSISADGSCIVFVSDAHLADLNATHKCDASAEKQGCLEVTRSKDQVYLTCDDGDSFTMVTPPSLASSSRSAGAQVSGDGKIVAFRSSSELIENVEVSGKDEAYMYEVATGKLEKVSNFGPACDTGAIYSKIVEMNPNASDTISSVSTSSCNYGAMKGFIPSVGTIGAGAPDQPSISDSGRFLSFTTNFDAANIRGTHEAGRLIASAHIFLFDAHLGVTWQVTNEGVAGTAYEQLVEDFCCPGASSSKKRGACSESNELKGNCCWQKPCFFTALQSELSGDGNSIVFSFGPRSHWCQGHRSEGPRDLPLLHSHVDLHAHHQDEQRRLRRRPTIRELQG